MALGISLLGKYSIAVLLVVAVLLPAGNAFAERQVDFQKVIDIDKASLQEYFEDINSLQSVFPKSIKSIHHLEETDSGQLFAMDLDLNGFALNPQVLYTKSSQGHHMKILDGDLRGTTITTTLQETWGFDGRPNQGTIVNVNTALHSSGLFMLVGFVPDDAITYAIDYGISNIAYDAKYGEPKEASAEPEEEPKPVKKRGYRTR